MGYRRASPSLVKHGIEQGAFKGKTAVDEAVVIAGVHCGISAIYCAVYYVWIE